MNYARIIDNIVAETVTQDPALIFHPDLAAQFAAVPESVERGMIHDPETDTFALPPAPEPQPATPPRVTAIEFKLCWTSPERVHLKAATETDPVLADFWGLVDDPRMTTVDLALASVQAGIDYALDALVTASVIASEDRATRREQILSGTIL